MVCACLVIQFFEDELRAKMELMYQEIVGRLDSDPIRLQRCFRKIANILRNNHVSFHADRSGSDMSILSIRRRLQRIVRA